MAIVSNGVVVVIVAVVVVVVVVLVGADFGTGGNTHAEFDIATSVNGAACCCTVSISQRIVGYSNNDNTMTKSEDNRIISVPVMSKYEFFQGTAMQQPSYIVVENIQIHSVVTQEEEDVHHHPQQPPNNTTREELSIFKYAIR